jgi:hypothetical protein
MQLVRRSGGGVIQPVGESFGRAGVIEFMDDPDLGGIVAVDEIAGHAGYRYLATFKVEFLDAQGLVEYLTNFDPRAAFPRVPATSHAIREPQPE